MNIQSQKFWQGKRVFVTRPRTYLGGWLCRELLKLNAEVFAYSEPEEFSSEGLFDLEGLALKVRLTEGRLTDRQVLKGALDYAQADIVLHLSPARSLRGNFEDPLNLVAQDVLGTTQLMDLLRETASVRSVVVMSSDKVYAPSGEELHEESAALAAADISTTTKMCSELIALSFRHQYFSPNKYNKHKIALATVRACTPYGPAEPGDESLMAQALQAMDAGESFTLKNPQSLRPWLHVQDLSEGVLLLAEALVEKGPKLKATYNLFSQTLESVNEVISTLYKIAGANFLESSEVNTKGISKHRHLSIAAAQEDLMWKPQVSIDVGLAEILLWHRGRQKKSSS